MTPYVIKPVDLLDLIEKLKNYSYEEGNLEIDEVVVLEKKEKQITQDYSYTVLNIRSV